MGRELRMSVEEATRRGIIEPYPIYVPVPEKKHEVSVQFQLTLTFVGGWLLGFLMAMKF